MALRDQPYFPLYVQDFLTDEKLIECSAEATGVYIRIMCIMHKSDEYGKILLKQKDKQSTEQINNFASKLVKQLPFTFELLNRCLTELVAEGVLIIEDDYLIQKRMVKDNYISLTRAKSGQKGGVFAQAKLKAKLQANSEYEIEYENEIVNEFENRLSVEEKKESEKKSKRFTPEQIQQLRSQNKCPLPDDYPVEWEKYVPAITERERYCTEKGVVIDLLPESEIMAMPSEVIREYASQMWALGADGYARQVGYLSDDKLKLERQLEEEEDAKKYQ